jgi:hypothetical protein
MSESAKRDNGFKNERVFTSWALKRARERGWLSAHLSNMRVVRRPGGDVFAVPDKDADGFPDLVLVHEHFGLVFAELKMPGRKPDEAQLGWLRALRSAGANVHVFYPRDVESIVELLDTGMTPQLSFDLLQREGATS